MATGLPPAVLAPTDPVAEARRARRATLITIGVLIALVALVFLLTPVTENESDTRLTTTKYGPGNARLAADLARRLGWQVRTSDLPLTAPLDTTVIYAVFAGPTAMARAEREALDSAVHHGAGLLVVPAGSEPFALTQSFGLRVTANGLVQQTPLGTCPPETDAFSGLRVRPRMLTFDTSTIKPRGTTRPVQFPANARTLLASEVSVSDDDEDDEDDAATADSAGRRAARDSAADSARSPMRPPDREERRPVFADSTPKVRTEWQPSVIAFPRGRGRVVAMADPDLLRTDQLRSCKAGTALTLVRSLEYLSEGRQRTIVFAEFYQGMTSDGPSVVVWEWLTNSAPGRALLTLMAACLVLLIARGRRTLAPVYVLREERRSALEHVDALATAWQTVRGTRTVARMLARGIRRRHAAGRWRTLDDTAFLAALAERHPRIADDAARLTAAIESPAAPSDLPALREAAAHIDAECLTP